MTAGRTRVAEMKDTSMAMRSANSPTCAAVKYRALVFSSRRTRRSWRRRKSIWPCPVSTATTRAAPCRSRQSVKPPVEAPTSRQVLPLTSMHQCSRARSSLRPPRLTYFRSSPSMGIDRGARLVDFLLIGQNLAGQDERLGAFPRGRQAAFDQQFVHSHFHPCPGTTLVVFRPTEVPALEFVQSVELFVDL